MHSASRKDAVSMVKLFHGIAMAKPADNVGVGAMDSQRNNANRHFGGLGDNLT